MAVISVIIAGVKENKMENQNAKSEQAIQMIQKRTLDYLTLAKSNAIGVTSGKPVQGAHVVSVPKDAAEFKKVAKDLLKQIEKVIDR